LPRKARFFERCDVMVGFVYEHDTYHYSL
jgi:hypothetical protein